MKKLPIKAVAIKALFCVLLAMSICTNADAKNIYWQNPFSDDWSTGANWGGGVEPGPFDLAVIDNGGTAQITLLNEGAQGLTIGSGIGDSGTVDMTSGSLTIFGGLSSMLLGNSGTGIFNQSGGTTTINNALRMDISGTSSSGSYNLTGGTLDIGGDIVNGAGTGTLNIDGGILNMTGLSIFGSSAMETIFRTQAA